MSEGDERRGKLRKASGRSLTFYDPGMSEWGNPAEVRLCHQRNEYIVSLKRTQGSETSQYLKERKSNESPLVAASEGGRA